MMTRHEFRGLVLALAPKRMDAYRMAAEILCVKPQTIEHWVHGRRNISPPMEKLIRLELDTTERP